MKPFDARLLRASPAVGRLLAWGVLWSLLQTAGIVLFAVSASAIVVAFAKSPLSMNWAQLLSGLLLGGGLRAVAVWGSARTASSGAAQAKAQLRELGMRAVRPGPALAGSSRAELTLTLTRGLDALDEYFSSYLPQLLLAAVATPILLIVIWLCDPTSGLSILLVLPLIPVFMVLIGLATRSLQDRQFGALNRLGGQFLDLVEGLSTLKIFRREHAQARGIAETGEQYRRRTMSVLRLSFLSGFVLELAATLSVALVAVLIGTRLVAGELQLSVGLLVLLLTPDVFAPLRQVGASFHAAADGLSAANALFALIERADSPERVGGATELAPAGPSAGSFARPSARSFARSVGQSPAPSHESSQPSSTALPSLPSSAAALAVRDLSVWRGDRAIIAGLSAGFAPAALTAVTGESGVGKTTLLSALLGFAPFTGEIRVGDRLIGPGSQAAARDALAWAPQRPSLSAGSIADNVALGDPTPELELVRRSLDRAAASELDPSARLGAGGSGLSGGQAQRVNLARALYRLQRRSLGILLLDEPSSALDGDAQQRVIAQLRELADSGVCVIVVSHRDGFVAAADAVLELTVRPAVAREGGAA